MARVFSDRTIVAIDVGTTKICVLVAERCGDNEFTITGIGKAQSDGLKRGVVVNIGQTVRSLKTAIKEAELTSGTTLRSAYIGISGAHIHSTNSPGSAPIKRGCVRVRDIADVMAAAKAIPIPEGQHIVHVVPQHFTIDHSERVSDPIGMHGVRLEVLAHVILGSTASVQNLVSCCQQADIHVRDVILEPLASARAVLNEDEQELGAGIVDIGGGTTDLAVYHHGSLRHTAVFPIAGNQFTRDMAIGLRTTIGDAERLKHEYAVAHPSMIEELDVEAEQLHGGDRQRIRHADVAAIVNARARELLTLIKQEIERHDIIGSMAAGLVITGGGSLLAGMDILAREIVDVPVRRGAPRIEVGMPASLSSPLYATAYGLLLCAIRGDGPVTASGTGSAVKRVVGTVRSWVADFF